MSRDKFIRPSSLGAISLCAARPTIEAAVVEAEGEPPSSDEADTGHNLHGRSQLAVTAWSESQGILPWGEIISMACNSATMEGIDSWSVWCLQYALEFIRDLVAKYDIQPENVLTEHALDMVSIGFTQPGTADVVLVVPNKLVIVVDYKFGYLDAGDADDHDQLQVYAAAAAETFKCEDVQVFLVQPRAEKPHRKSGARFDAETLRSNRAWTAAVVRRARVDDPELEPGYSQCVYCKALTRCPAAKEFFMHAKEALELIGPPADADARGELISAAKIAKKWADDVNDWGKAEVMNGNAATGWKLGPPRALRTVISVPAAIQLLEAAGMGKVALDALSMSVTKLTPEAERIIHDLVTEKMSAPSLVQEKRAKA